MKITTNNVPRPLLYGNELTDSEREWWSDLMEDVDSGTFFRYRGSVYSLSQFEFIDGDRSELSAKGWHGILPETYFSAIVVKLVDDNDYIVVGFVFA